MEGADLPAISATTSTPATPGHEGESKLGAEDVSIPITRDYPDESASGEEQGNNPDDALAQALGHHEKLNFQMVQRRGFSTSAMVVQIRDPEGQPLMSTLNDPGIKVTIPTHDSEGKFGKQTAALSTGAKTNFTNAQGIIVMSAKDSSGFQTVSSGNRILGLIEGASTFSTKLRIRNALGEPLFETGEAKGAFSFELNGVQIAWAGRSPADQGGDFSVEFSNALDLNTKAMVVATAYHVYHLYFAESILGLKGARGVQLAICFFLVVMFVVLLVVGIVIYRVGWSEIKEDYPEFTSLEPKGVENPVP